MLKKLGIGTRSAFYIIAVILLCVASGRAQTSGSISGTVKDVSGGVVQSAAVSVRNVDTSVQQTVSTNDDGFYAFTVLPVGRYDLSATVSGFKAYKRTGLVIDVNTKLQVDVNLELGDASEEVTVSDTAVHVETSSTQVGEVVPGEQIVAVALNGRSFTDLMALQPGIVPMSTQKPDDVVMAGATVAIAPSGGLNAGNQSINGQREDANGFLINGGDVKEGMNGGTSIVPNLDSIAEFRIMTSNFDAESGNYSGGIIDVATKSGTNQLHGSGFEFLRNTSLDARNFFSIQRGAFEQNQFGGTIGGPIKKDKLFFFADYQGTRTTQGIDTGLIPVPSLADRTGNLADQADSLVGAVAGPYLANLLSQRLGYAVAAGEPYYTPGCDTGAQCVFPNAVIPVSAWSAPSKNLLAFIPTPNIGNSTFSTGSQSQKVRDDKISSRIDTHSNKWGDLSAYYFFDDHFVDNPYPTGQGGASVPGFNALNFGRAQLINLSGTKAFGSSLVNEFHLSFMRNDNVVGQPQGGVGPTLASQGFFTGVGTAGIVPLAPQIEGIENIFFNSFKMGTPITNLAEADNTYLVSDSVSKVLRNHTLKTGFNLRIEQENVNPNPTFNGSFLFTGSETGLDFADFLIGVPSNYNQADSQHYYPRHRYMGAFLEDSWRVRPNLTLNGGIRWERMEYWSEKYNQAPAFMLGEQSVVFPTAPVSLVYAGDRGVAKTIAPSANRFAPRLGLAYSPDKSDGILGKILGGPGKTSIRASFGMFYSVIQGNTLAFDEPQPPYGLSYTSPQAPLFDQPFRAAADGSFLGNPFPLTFPPLDASPSKPNSSIDFSQFQSIAGMTGPAPANTFPYTEQYFLSVDRALSSNTVLSLSYIGSQAHHLLVVYSINPGNPALCLALSQQSAVAPNTQTCGEFGEDADYTTAGGQTIQGTRVGLGPAFSNDDYEGSIGNASYNSFQANVRRAAKGLTLSGGYTYSKSLDQASALGDPGNPFDFHSTRALSAWDLKHNFVATYDYSLPFDRLINRARRWTEGWTISGITRVSSGFPVTMHADGDRSFTGSVPNGVNNHSLDLPDYAGGPLNLNSDPRNGQPYFDTTQFSPNAFGTLGTANRRFFYGPGMFNTDMALAKVTRITESKTLQIRLEAFNVFNHAQFFGPSAVDGEVSSALFGQIVNAAPPRLMQIGAKFLF